MPSRIDKLTEAQKAHFTEWGDRWIEIGLRTGAADRDQFERAVRKCYEFSGLEQPKVIVWIPSPLVGAIAFPVAALMIELIRKRHVDGAVAGAVGDAVDSAVREAVGEAVGDAVDSAVREAVDGAVAGAEEPAIRKAVADAISRLYASYVGGQFWVGGWYWGGAYTSFFREVCDLALEGNLWERGKAYEQICQSACWWYPHRDFVMVCERPTQIHRELVNPAVTRGWGSHRLHNASGPAVGFKDGWGVWAWHGVRVPRYIIEQPHLITVAMIEAEQNAEVRRVMIERYGQARYVHDSGAVLVHELSATYEIKGLRGAKLYRKDVAGNEPIYLISVDNYPRTRWLNQALRSAG